MPCPAESGAPPLDDRDAGARQLIAQDRIGLGRETDFLLSVPPEHRQFCELPVTTTRLVASLLDGADARLLTREFAATYTFVGPASATND